MKVVLKALLLGGTILASGGRLEAQAEAPGRLAVLAGAPARVPSLDSTGVDARLDRAEALYRAMRTAEARRELRAVAELQEASGELPRRALWLLSELYHGEGQPLRAAAVLDRLAEGAARHGDPVVRARALLEAAVIYQDARDPERALARVEQLLPLLSSPYLPAEVRASIEGRILR